MHSLHQGEEAHVKTQHLVFCVVDDPGNLLGVQTRVDGVQHTARTTHAEIHFHVAIAVPGQGSHTVAERQPLLVQRVGQLARARRQITVGVAVNIAFHTPRNNFPIAVVALGKFNQRRNQQWLTLHQTQHMCSFNYVCHKNRTILTGELAARTDDGQIHKT